MKLRNADTGKVILAAAGPGDPELITMKAVRYLQQADVVLTDRLVSEDILDQYVHPDAEIIYVGKQCRRGNSTSQLTINELMVQLALEGKLVVRLKGGDVSVFSNILDELQALVEYNIPYEIVPGVTAALGAAAYAGIPLTARGYSTGIRFLTFYKSDIIKDTYWKELAETEDTLVFYMSAETLDLLTSRLLEHGISGEKQMAIIEQATTPQQHIITMTLDEYKQRKQETAFISPTLLIIGKVVELQKQFGWIENNNERSYYFDPERKPLENMTKIIYNSVNG
jgi:uroporphyrin-III C-methyltransferase/precorrin-2 dehydrogenase/sirohydrochlorin ferrochelatase/uroporphyrin-III C-methyltransferase